MLVRRGKIKEGSAPEPYRPEYEKIEGADNLFFYKGAVKVSQIERFYACPYAHLLEYGLRLRERPEAEPDGANIGTLLHIVLERFMKCGMTRGGAEIFDEVIAAPEYAFVKNSPAAAPVFKRLRRECQKVCGVMKEQQAFGGFMPRYFELDFLKDNTINSAVKLDAGGRQIALSGKIDRVDVFEADGKRYARVIDYKSGVKETNLSYSKLYRGENIQLLVYLAYMRAAGYKPAGAFYFKVHDAGGGFCMKGIVNRENEIPRMMDARLSEHGFKSDIICISTTKKGEYGKHAYAVTEDEINGLCDYALEKMRSAGGRISCGECTAFPLPDVCGFCSFGGICGFDPERDEVREEGRTFRTAEELLGDTEKY
jgi:ATP-dependent helicase/nuclease subunit B